MKRKQYSDEQIIAILKEHEAGMKVQDLVRKYGVSDDLSPRLIPLTRLENHHIKPPVLRIQRAVNSPANCAACDYGKDDCLTWNTTIHRSCD